MDPLSAVGLASAIVAIIDFSWKLITGTWEIHQSLDGVTAENAHLEDVTGHLESLMQALKADIPIKTTAERNIQRLAKECEEDAETLRALLMEMKVPGRRRLLWKSLNAKWKSILNMREVAELKSRIQESRDDIQVNLIAMLKEDQSAIGLQITRIEQECDDLKSGQPRQLKELQAELLDSLTRHGDSIQQQLQDMLQDMQRLITTISMQHRILRHLIPDEISSRQDQILEADPDTYRWILEPGLSYQGTYRQKICENFTHWLRAGRNVLHISGNPGAGKSTLMKFIGGSPRTLEELKVWAGRRQLVFGQFYFWAAGTEAQRTLPGMLRSLLFQVLSQCPQLVEDVFPHQISYMKTSRSQFDPSLERFQDFGNKQIQGAFDLLLNKTVNSDHRIFFLIDGLDEFEGGELDHEDMAVRLNSWTIGGDIKVLVSSRPWRPFLKTFTDHPTLHLHELNELDIRKYAFNCLYQDREIRQLGVDRMKTTIGEIVEELADQAQGIFLWAHLVLDAVRQGIRRKYSVGLLKEKMREYPSDLDGLYDALREPIEKSPIDRKLSNRMLLLAAAVPKDFPLHALAFSWLPEDDDSGLLDPNFPPSTKCQPYSEQDVEERLQCVAERVNGLTRGLLEIDTLRRGELDTTPQVRFCHRTARDYIITNVKRYAALGESWPDFRQSDPYGRIYLADLIYSRVCKGRRFRKYLNKPFCRDFSLDTIRKFETPIRPLLFPEWSWGSRCCPRNNPETVSFLHYAAYCDLDRFVFYELANNARGHTHPPETNMLLTSMYWARRERDENYNLALGLLRSCVNRYNTVEADVQVECHPEAENGVLPAWMIALIRGFQRCLEHCSHVLSGRMGTCDINRSLLEVCRLLNELAVKLGQRLSVTVDVGVCYSRERRDRAGTFHPCNRRTFSASRVLDWAENLYSVVSVMQENKVTEERRSRSWVLDTVPIMLKKNFPRAVSQEYRITSWELDSPTRSMVGEHTSFNYKVY